MKHSKRGNGPDACVLQRPAPGSGSIRPQGDGRLRSCGRIHRTWTSHGASGGRVMGRVAGAQESSSTTTYWPRRNCSWKRTPGAPFGSDHLFAPSDVWVADWGPTLQPAPHGGHQYLGGRGRPSRCPGPPGAQAHQHDAQALRPGPEQPYAGSERADQRAYLMDARGRNAGCRTCQSQAEVEWRHRATCFLAYGFNSKALPPTSTGAVLH